MSKKKIIVLIVAVILIITLILFRVMSLASEGDNEVSYVSTLIEDQANIEDKFKSEGYTINNPNVILNPYGNSPLTALVIFETKDEESVSIRIKGKDELSTYSHTFDKGKVHYIPVYGLYAGRKNEVLIKAGDEENTLEIETDKLPDDFIMPTKVTKDESKLTNDLYFFTPSSKGYTCAYDVNGDVRWY